MEGRKDGTPFSFVVYYFLSDVFLLLQDTLTSTLELYVEPGGYSAMAKTVGIPCGIATQLVLDGVLNKVGVQAPYSMDIVKPIMELLEAEGLGMVERVL